jgi:DNA-binding transcriptional LysR family regulator
MYRPEQLDIVTRHLGGIEIGCFAARSYLDRAGWPAGPEDLAGHALIGFDRSELMLRGMRAAGWQVQREDFTLRTDDQVAYFEYLRAGCGIGFFQAEVARRTEGIEEIPLGIPVPPLPVWIAAHEKVRRIPRVDLVWRMLEGGLAPFLQRG